MPNLNELEFRGLNATCKNCDEITFFTGRKRWRLYENGVTLVHYQSEYQCQDCGELEFEDIRNATHLDWLIGRCSCGGEFRRDKPVFCKHCKANRTEFNVSQPELPI